MYNHKKVLAVIPARFGSKRLPNKNIRLLNEKPLIGWTIETAQQSKFIDKVIVSTDSEEIASISREFGVEIPFLRPANLSDDKSDSISVIKHTLDFYNSEFDIVILLQPTSPLRKVEDIDEALKLLSQETRAVISVCSSDYPPVWSNTLLENNSMRNFMNSNLKSFPSQDLSKYYRLNGSIYISFIKDFIINNGFFCESTKAYIMPRERSVDIDNLFDFNFAEYLIKTS